MINVYPYRGTTKGTGHAEVHNFALSCPYEFFDSSTAQQLTEGAIRGLCAWDGSRLVGLLTWLPAGVRPYALLIAIESRTAGGGTQLLRELDKQLTASGTRHLRVTALQPDSTAKMRHLLAKCLTIPHEVVS